MKIGTLAARAGCQPVTIRYYEKIGLLPPAPRDEGNYRVYSRVHEERLLFIRRCRSLDMSLDEVRQLLACQAGQGADCSDVNTLVDEHIQHVAQRIQTLQALQQQLVELRQQCDRASEVAACPILQGLATGDLYALTDMQSHLGHSHD